MNIDKLCSVEYKHEFDFSGNGVLWIDDHSHTKTEEEFSSKVKNVFSNLNIKISKENEFRHHLNFKEICTVFAFFIYLNLELLFQMMFNIVVRFLNRFVKFFNIGSNIVSNIGLYKIDLKFPVLYPCWGKKYLIPSNTLILFTGVPNYRFFERLYKFRKMVSIIEVSDSDLLNTDSVFQHNFNLDHILKGFMSWIGVSSSGKFRLYSINGCSRVYDWDFLEEVKLDMMTKFFSKPRVPRHTDFNTTFGHFNHIVIPSHLRNYYADTSHVLTEKQLLPIKRDISYLGCNLITYTAKKFLCDRNGMSYGFLAYQLPVKPGNITEVNTVPEFEKYERNYGFIGSEFYFKLNGRFYRLEMPDIDLATTRSGCNKSAIDPNQDLILYNISDTITGKLQIKQYISNKKVFTQPSFDIWVILVQAICNAIIVSILHHFNPNNSYLRVAREKGLMIIHVHGFPNKNSLDSGILIAGSTNPSITCGCPESSYYCYHNQILEFLNNLPKYVNEYDGSLFLEKDHGVVYTAGYRDSVDEIARLFESYEYGEKNFSTFN